MPSPFLEESCTTSIKDFATFPSYKKKKEKKNTLWNEKNLKNDSEYRGWIDSEKKKIVEKIIEGSSEYVSKFDYFFSDGGVLVRKRGFLVLRGMPSPFLRESCTTSIKDTLWNEENVKMAVNIEVELIQRNRLQHARISLITVPSGGQRDTRKGHWSSISRGNEKSWAQRIPKRQHEVRNTTLRYMLKTIRYAIYYYTVHNTDTKSRTEKYL